MSSRWSRLRRKSSALFLAVAAPWFAAAALVPGPERPVSSPVLATHARVGGVHVASEGLTILAVWADRRTDRGNDIFAARLDRNGRLLDQTNIPISTVIGVDELDPLVEYNGTNFVVVWFDGTNTIAAEVSSAGIVVTPPTVIAKGRPVSVTRGTRDVGIVINDTLGASVGVIRPGLEYGVAATLRPAQQIDVTRVDSGFLAFFADPVQNRAVIRAIRLDTRGRILESFTLATLGSFSPDVQLSVATAGNVPVLAAFSRDRMVIARVTATGTVTPVTIVEGTASRLVEEILVSNNTSYDIVAIVDGGPRIYRYIDDVLITEDRPLLGPAFAGSATISAGRVFSVWQIDGLLTGRFAFAQNEPAIAISHSVANQQMPVVATDGVALLAVWTEDQTDTRDRIRGMVLHRDGTPVSGEPKNLATRTAASMTSQPAIAYFGNQYYLAYVDAVNGVENPARLLIRHIDRAGNASGDDPVTTTASPFDPPSLAPGPTDALVVWTRSAPQQRVRAAFVSRPQIHIEIEDLLREPAVVYANNAYLIVGVTTSGSIRGIRVSTTGVVGATLFETIGTNDREPAIASSGAEQLIVFRRGASIWGRFAGTGLELAIAESGDDPRVTWDGNAFVVAWQNGGDVFTTRVQSSGTVEAPVVLSGTPRNDEFPALLGLGGGTTFAAYQRMVPELQNLYRVFTRVITTQEPEPPKPTRRRSVR